MGKVVIITSFSATTVRPANVDESEIVQLVRWINYDTDSNAMAPVVECVHYPTLRDSR